MKSFKTFIYEGANLAPGELYKYDWRVDLFCDKYKDSKPLKLVSGAEVILKYDADIETQVRSKQNPAKITFVGVDGNEYKLSSFTKTSEFGGGGGVGAGAELTKTTESAQAVYAQARWMNLGYDEDGLTKAFAVADTDAKLFDIINGLPKEWMNSCKIGAEKLHDEFGSKTYTFHRGSSFVEKLEKTFKRLNSQSKTFANLNKWSPADIYLVSPHGATINFDKITCLLELNNVLTDNLKTKDIIGVSLKLIKKNAVLSFNNFGSGKPSVKFENFSTGTVSFFGGKDVYVYFTVNGKIQFRTFSPTTFQGEIKGKQANQGKLSYGPIQKVLKQLKIESLTDMKQLRNHIQAKHSETLNKFYEYYTRYSKDTSKKTLVDFIAICDEKGNDWVFSKFLGCELIDVITRSGKQDEFVSGCIQYASSSSEMSAPFAKLE